MSRYIDAELIEIPIMESKTDETWMKVAIEAVPTADVREHIRGEWKEIDGASGIWACSVCGWSVILHSGTPSDQHCNFCTNCGAEMQNAKQELVKDLVNEPRADEWSIDPRELEEDYLFLWEDVKDEQIH